MASMIHTFYQFLLILVLFPTIGNSQSGLELNFYGNQCPVAEEKIFEVVSKAVIDNPGLGAGLIRLHFHDCFVRGCDASVLLDSANGTLTEKENPINKDSLRGFEVVDEAKRILEEICPNTVSCADILALASRDSAKLLGDIEFGVPTGRRDGIVSLFNEPFKFLPGPDSNLSFLIDIFANKGLTVEEMIILSGAHSIGVSKCFFFNNNAFRNPSMSQDFLDVLDDFCPNKTNSTTFPMDLITPNKLDGGSYYKNVLGHRVVFKSDQALTESVYTKRQVEQFAHHEGAWKEGFGKAMIRMGSIQVLTGNEGEIRQNCRVVNKGQV